jgi:hypothetical protein
VLGALLGAWATRAAVVAGRGAGNGDPVRGGLIQLFYISGQE